MHIKLNPLKIFSAKKVSFAVVETTWGDFRVHESGWLLKWDEDLGDWNPVSSDDRDSGEWDGIIQAGLDALNRG